MPVRRLLVSVLGCAAVAALAPSVAAAQPTGGGNSSAALACQQRGFVQYVRSDGSTFASTGDCVSYAAAGGSLVPVALDVSFVPDPTRPVGDTFFENLTVTGSGLEPGSTVSSSFIPYGTGTRSPIVPTAVNHTVAADGTFSTAWSTGCPLDRGFVFYATTAYGQQITATGC